MIVNKIYEVNTRNLESVILALAEEIKNGFEIKQIDILDRSISANTWDDKPTYAVHLHNTGVDKHK